MARTLKNLDGMAVTDGNKVVGHVTFLSVEEAINDEHTENSIYYDRKRDLVNLSIRNINTMGNFL